MISIIRGSSHTSIWIWKILITLEYYNRKTYRVDRFPKISIDWNPS